MNTLLKDDELNIHKFLSSYDDRDYVAKMHINSGHAHTYHHKIADVKSNENSFSKGNDMYMSVNPMTFIDNTICRDKAHVGRLMFCYADIDCYKLGMSKAQVLGVLYEDYFNSSIPFPSYIIDSGRGLYLFWRVNEHVKAYPRWKKVQKYFHETLKELGSDPAVTTDSARVFRIIGSVNSKNGETVKVLDGCCEKYSLYHIMKEYMPEEYQKIVIPFEKKDKPKNKKAERKSKFDRKIVNMPAQSQMLVNRLEDLETLLLDFRDYEGAGRENILFLYRYFYLCLTGDKEYSFAMTKKLNGKMKYPLDEKELANATKSAEKGYEDGQKYVYSNSKLCEFLQITDKEATALVSILTKTVKKSRKQVRNKQYYADTLAKMGKDTKKVSMEKRLAYFYAMLQEGLCREEICQNLNISRSTFYNLKKEINSMTKEQLEQLRSLEDTTKGSDLAVLADSPNFSAFAIRERDSSAIQSTVRSGSDSIQRVMSVHSAGTCSAGMDGRRVVGGVEACPPALSSSTLCSDGFSPCHEETPWFTDEDAPP